MTRVTPDPYRDFFERSRDAHLIIEGDRFVDCNQATVEMLRYRNKQELLQTHPSQLSPDLQPDGRPSYEKANEMMAQALATGSHRFEWDHRRADGEVFPVEVLLTMVPGAAGPRLHTVWRDITERKRLETELRQAQKMEAVGKLAGGIAHDFNNLLVAILGHSELLETTPDLDQELIDHAAEIRRAGERAADLVSQLLAFSRKQVLAPRVIDVVPLLNDLGGMLQRLIGEGITLESRLPDHALCTLVDPGQLEQVVINLVTNARDSIQGDGTITLSAALQPLTTPDPGSGVNLPVGDYIMITVADTGSGIPPHILDHIFDPFFTTKGQGSGTGLGLATVYGIIKQSGGDIEVTSEEDLGTWFRVYLPLSRELPTPAPAPQPTTDAGSGGEVVLLAEDDTAVAKLTAKVLRRQGYKVLLAGDGLEALELVEREGIETVDVLLTDVVMPRMGGLELVDRLLQQRPDLPVLLTSGYSEDVIFRDSRENLAVELLPKPYSPQELCARIRDVLGQET